MAKHTVLLLGATGQTGGSILDGLVKAGGFVRRLSPRSTFLRPKPAVKEFESRGFPIILSDLTEPVKELASKLKGFDTVISSVDASGLLAQLNLINAAAKAGTKRFLPCAYATVCPPGGVMQVRDTRETVFNAVLVAKVPYTIVDIGFWHQASFPSVPSGKMDYAKVFPGNRIFGDGEAPNILTDKRDIGHLVARIIKDDRTLNRKVGAVGDVLSQKQIREIVERASDEKPEMTYALAEELIAQLDAAKVQAAAPGTAGEFNRTVRILGYHYSKYIRKDNMPENAKYLGYLDARELYPDFKAISFESFVKEILDGKAKKPYADGRLDELIKKASQG